METLLRFDNVSKQYANWVHALNAVSFDVEEGEFISAIGPSGSGKSTLLRSMTRKRNIACIVNLHQLDVALQYSTRIIGLSKGEIVFDGPPQQLDDETIQRIYGTTRENLMLGGKDHA